MGILLLYKIKNFNTPAPAALRLRGRRGRRGRRSRPEPLQPKLVRRPVGFRDRFARVEWKQAANVAIATHALVHLGDPDNLNALVLDGARAGTTTVLTQFGGLRAANITAVTKQPGAAASIRRRHRDATVHEEDLDDFIDRSDGVYDLIYVDLCATWRKGRETIFNALRAATDRCVFSFAVCRRNDRATEDQIMREFAANWKQAWPLYSYRHVRTIATRCVPSYFVFIYELGR